MKIKSLSAFSSRTFMYRFYRLFPKWKMFETKSMKDFSDIVREFHKDFISEVTHNRYGAELPLNMGKLMLVSYRSKRQYPCFSGRADRSPTMFMNDHTDGLRCKLLYTNYDYKLKDKFVWKFVPEVKFKKAASMAFSDNFSKYIFNPDKVDRFYKELDFKKKDAADRKIEKFLLTHNEFELN